MKVFVRAPTTLLPEEGGEPIREATVLQSLDGRRHEGSLLSDYLGDFDVKGDADIGGGTFALRLRDDGRLWVESEYEVSSRLSADQLDSLVRFTRGQWQEGIGESFNGALGDEHGWFLRFHGDETETIQEGTEKKRSKLWSAIRKGDLAAVTRLVEQGEDLDATNAKQKGVVENAIDERHDQVAAYLIRAGAPTPPYVPQPVIACAMSETLSAFIDRGVDANASADDWFARPPLFWAANRGEVEMAKLLIEAGADVDYKDPNGHTALMMADRHPAVFELLLQAGADIGQKGLDDKNIVELVFAESFERAGREITEGPAFDEWREQMQPFRALLSKYHPEAVPVA